MLDPNTRLLNPIILLTCGRRPNSARAVLKGGGRKLHGVLNPSLKHVFSESVLAGGPRGPSLT